MNASRIALAALLGMGGLAAFAQIPVPPPNTTNTPDQQGSSGTSTPKSGPIKPNDALSSPKTTTSPIVKSPQETDKDAGPEIGDETNLTPEQKASVEYSGPAVLSRGITASQPMNPQNVRFTPQVSLEYTDTSGLGGVVQSGVHGNQSGMALNYGITGTKLFRMDTFSLSYTGSMFHYFTVGNSDSVNNQARLAWTHQLNKRLKFGIQASLQEFDQNTILISGSQVITSGVGTTLVTASPATEAFDGRVLTTNVEGSLTYNFTPRLSFNLSGSGFLTRRFSTSLYGDVGFQGTGDALYRFTKRVTGGVFYSYTHFDYIGLYGGSDVNTVGLEYAVAFTRRTELSTRLGGSRLETTGVQDYALPPALAAILGFSTTSEAAYHRNYAPDMNIRLSHRRSNVSFEASYSRGITPGNGIILTSIRQNASVGANYKTRRWNYASSFGYDSLHGYGTTSQKYNSDFANVSVYRNIAGSISWHARFDYHHYLLDNTGFLRNNYTFATGIAWSPGDLLNRPW